MRKIAAILLMFILLFNIGGYRLTISLLQNNADDRLETQLDNSEYYESQLIEIKVALNMPYQERFTDFERHYGQIEIDGRSYTYVKKKIAGDVVIFKCIANETRQQLKSIQNDLAKANSTINIDQPGQQKQQSSFAKNFWSEYDEQIMLRSVAHIAPINNRTYTYYSFFLPEPTRNIPHQPPEAGLALS